MTWMSATNATNRPTWTSRRQIPTVCAYWPHLKRTVTTALIVGSILFAINQFDVVLRGDASLSVWVKGGLTYIVPFVVSNIGVLIASRAP